MNPRLPLLAVLLVAACGGGSETAPGHDAAALPIAPIDLPAPAAPVASAPQAVRNPMGPVPAKE